MSATADRLGVRLAELRAELHKGQAELVRLEQRRAELRDAVLRIGGAIQVLEELQVAEVRRPEAAGVS